MNTLLTHLENIVSVGSGTLVVISLLCATACYFVKEYLAQPPMIIFIFPVMVFFGLLAFYIFVTTEQFQPKKMDQWLMWTILAAICGAVVGIAIVTILAAVRERLGSGRAPLPTPTRATTRR
jgi:hypothetical protein